MERIGSKYRLVDESTNITIEKWFIRGKEGYYKDEICFINSGTDACYIPIVGFNGIDRIVVRGCDREQNYAASRYTKPLLEQIVQNFLNEIDKDDYAQDEKFCTYLTDIMFHALNGEEPETYLNELAESSYDVDADYEAFLNS